MRRYIPLIILIICIISGVFVYATYSWFTLRLQNRGNSLSTGVLSIKVPNSSVTSGITMIDNIYPGWEQSKNFRIENDGSIDFDYRLYIDDKNLIGNPLYDGETPLQIKVERNNSALNEYTDINDLGYINLGLIKTGGYDNLRFHLRLPKEADNEYQGKSIELAFAFEAVQKDAPFSVHSKDLQGKTWYVKPGQKISDVLKSANDNDTVIVEYGSYTESIDIEKPVKLIGIQKDFPSYNPDGSINNMFNSAPIIHAAKNYAVKLKGNGTSDVFIKGFRIESKSGIGITSDGDIRNIDIENNKFTFTADSSISFSNVNTENLTIKNNCFDCWSGIDVPAIMIEGGKNRSLTILGNAIKGANNKNVSSRGIMIDNGEGIYISNNFLSGLKRFAVQVTRSINVVCSYNKLNELFYAFQFLSYGSLSKNIRISKNTFNNIEGKAIYINSIKDSSPAALNGICIEDNSFEQDLSTTTSTEYIPFYIYFDEEYSGQHGPIEFKDNRIFLKGILGRYTYLNALRICGKISSANITGNVFDASQITKYKKPDLGIYIENCKDALINTEGNTIKNFITDIFKG